MIPRCLPGRRQTSGNDTCFPRARRRTRRAQLGGKRCSPSPPGGCPQSLGLATAGTPAADFARLVAGRPPFTHNLLGCPYEAQRDHHRSTLLLTHRRCDRVSRDLPALPIGQPQQRPSCAYRYPLRRNSRLCSTSYGRRWRLRRSVRWPAAVMGVTARLERTRRCYLGLPRLLDETARL